MAIAGTIPVAKWLAKIKRRSDGGCRLLVCKRARKQRGASIENLPEQTYRHIKSAFCDGMATTVTAVHFIWRYLYASMQAAQTTASKLRFVTPDTESSNNTLWQEKEFEQIRSRESLTEKDLEIEKKISVKEHERERHDFDTKIFYENRYWNRRPDGILINENHQTLYILEFKRSSDRNEEFLGVKEAKAHEQHKRIIEALKAAAPELTFVCNKLERLSVQAGKKDEILAAHVQRICKVHDTVIQSYCQQIQGSSGADATTSIENIEEHVYV